VRVCFARFPRTGADAERMYPIQQYGGLREIHGSMEHVNGSFRRVRIADISTVSESWFRHQPCACELGPRYPHDNAVALGVHRLARNRVIRMRCGRALRSQTHARR